MSYSTEKTFVFMKYSYFGYHSKMWA